MAASAITPHVRIDNSIIDDLAAQIGIYGLGIYVAIKRHLNQKTGDCFPSYKPTVCHDVISLVASSCGYNRGEIEPRVAH
jgi:hypothetical protein